MINSTIRLLFVLVSLPLSLTLNTPCAKNECSTFSSSKKLIDAYALYVAITKQYKQQWETIEQLPAHSKKLQSTIHTIVLQAQNQPPEYAMSFAYKENQSYQELPYLYCKKNLSTTKKKIVKSLEKLNSKNNIAQSAIVHCLTHTLTKIKLLEDTVVTTPEYYNEQIKIASVKHSPIVLQILQASIGFVVKKFIPLF